ncbi:MAG: glycosyltransferase [Parcubacteria group bacterium]|nr:glycosyltransferase [Parcubacteria group bacterium]
MRLIYIANARIPTEKAHGLQIMKMCEQFSGLECGVELLVPKRINKLKQSPFDFYGVGKSFEIKKVFSLDLLPFEKFFGRLAFYIQNISFAKCAAFYCLFKKEDIIFSRDLFSALILSFFGKKVCYEVHDSVPINFWTKRFLKNISKFVSTNNYKKQELIDNFGIDPEKILVAPNGVDLELFDVEKSKQECRAELNLPLDKKIILYTGNTYGWKGVDILAQADNFLENSCLVQIITDKPYSEIPRWLKSADVLVLPNSRRASEMQAKATSPIKLFEYMASGTPIVASDIPAIREIVSEKEVYFVESDSPEKLAEGIKKVLGSKACSNCISRNSKEKVKEYTWKKRAEKIIKFL